MNIYSYEELEDIYKSKKSIQRVIFTFLLIIITLLVYLLFSVYNIKLSDDLFLLFLLSIFIMHLNAFEFIFKDSINLNQYSNKEIGHLKTEEIRRMINAILADLKESNHEVPDIFILKGKSNEVMTVNVAIFNRIKKLNCIYIGENVFSFLNKSEIKAALLHELAHFKKFVSVFTRYPSIFIIFPNLFSLCICLLLGFDSSIILSVLGYVFFLFLGKYLLVLFFPFSGKMDEYFSDFHAAVKGGKIHIINALLRLYKMDEKIIYIYEKLYKLTLRSKDINLSDIQEIAVNLFQKLPVTVFSRKKINQLIVFELETYRNDNEVIGFLDRSTIKERNKKIRELITMMKGKRNLKTIPWKEFDFNKIDFRIDEKEYPYLIKSIKDNPGKQLVETISDSISLNFKYIHPTLRERILFLDKNLS